MQTADAVPEFVRLDALLKATPQEDGGRRFIYFEASNEDVDHSNEVTLQKALAESADYFLRHGNIDLSHYTLLGPRSGLSNFLDFEVGRPVDARVDGSRTFVKAELYQGQSPQAKNADMVWSSMTRQTPPSRWYPSVGGAILAKSQRFHKALGRPVDVITKVRWNNIALDRCPVNKTVGEAAVVPIGVFAKSMGGLVLKTLTAGYGTDSAGLVGGAALRMQSLDGALKDNTYFRLRDQIAAGVRTGLCGPAAGSIAEFAERHLGVSPRESAGLARRFLSDLRSLIHKEKLQ